MDATSFLFLIKTIEDNKVQITTNIEEKEGVVYSEGKICAVLKRYTPPIDMMEAFSDIQKYSRVKTAAGINKYGKVFQDHLGNVFDSIFQMCSYHSVSVAKYNSRINRGWSIEEALTGEREKKKVFDHLGNEFDTKSDMCQHYGIPLSRFNARINAGHTIEEALQGLPDDQEKMVEDHLGNKYTNATQMCKHYGVRMDLYCARKKRGWTLEEALTGRKKDKSFFDHKGNNYDSLADLCATYEVSPTNYQNRIRAGWTVEEALTGVRKKNLISDHLGNLYTSYKDMCDSYGIKYITFKNRIKKGWTLEKALTENTNHNPNKAKETVIDHLGNEYESIQQMCDTYKIGRSTFTSRLNAGFSLEQALLGKRKDIDTSEKPERKPHLPFIHDHLGNEYASLKEMCNAYGIRVDTYKARIKQGYSLEKALTRIPSKSTTGIPCQDHLGNHYASMAEMARAYGLTKETFISRKRNGWTIERILSTPEHGTQAFMYNGKSYNSKKEFCEVNGIKYDTFIHKLKRGYTIEEAMNLEVPIRKKNNVENKEVTDHKGTHFKSIEEMCTHYGIRVASYRYRLQHGWSMEEALTIPNYGHKKQERKENYKYYDHNGKGFSSIKAMCNYHGISTYLYKKLHEQGLSLNEILEFQPSQKQKFHFKDHLGKEYQSLKDMCSAWSISVHTYQKRIANGYTIEHALTERDEEPKVYDHKGNTYPTLLAMCKAYNISLSLYFSRIRRGKTLEEALETPKEDNSIVYKNIRYNTAKELAGAFGINAGTFTSRLKLGWTIEEAISGIKHSREYYDHLGKAYPSQKAMCKVYGIDPSVFQSRVKNGWTVEQALLNQKPEREAKHRKRKDHLGNEYPDLEAMCKAYGINVATYQKRISRGLNIEEALTSKEPLERILDHKGQEYQTIKEMCNAYNISTSHYYQGIKKGKDIATILEGKAGITAEE